MSNSEDQDGIESQWKSIDKTDGAPLEEDSVPQTAPPPVQQYPLPHLNPPTSNLIQLKAGKHSAVLAVLLSLIIIGAGQMYNRQIIKGVVFLLVAIFAVPSSHFIFWFLFAIMSSIDAYQIGNKLRSGRPVGKWEFF